MKASAVSSSPRSASGNADLSINFEALPVKIGLVRLLLLLFLLKWLAVFFYYVKFAFSTQNAILRSERCA